MSNKNHKVINNTNGNGTETKEKSWIKQRIEKVNVKSVAKTCGKVVVGFCALVGAAGIGSYAADQIGKPKTQIPDPAGAKPDLDA